MFDKKRLLTAGLAITLSVMMVTPSLAAPKTVNKKNNVNNSTKVSSALKKSKAKVGTLSQEDRNLLKNMFDAKFYATMYPEAAKLVGNDANKLFDYFIRNGLSEGQQINKDFNVNAYRSAYSDLNSKYGTDILSYYKHYETEGKSEGRTITTVEKAKEQGIIVTDFGGNKMAVNESGSIVAGEEAEKIILTDKAYVNAVDIIVAAELGVSPTQAFLLQKTEFIANVAATEGQAVANMVSQVASKNAEEVVLANANAQKEQLVKAQEQQTKEEVSEQIAPPSAPVSIYNESAYQAAMAKWRRNEPKKETFSASYMEEKAEWQAEKPVRSTYDIETAYATKAQAEAAYNTDYTNWTNKEPKVEDYMTSTEKTNFENAKSNWESNKPQRDDYKVTLYDTEANAKAAYREDYAEWESNAPKRSDYVVGKYPTKELAKVAFENDLREWETNEPKITDAKYSVGKYTSNEAAQSAYNSDYTAWQNEVPNIYNGNYTVGNYDNEEEANEAWRIACEEHKKTEPKPDDYVYYENKYGSADDAKAHYDADLAKYQAYYEWNNTTNSYYEVDVTTVYIYNGFSGTDRNGVLRLAKDDAMPDNDITSKPQASDYVYHENKYGSRDEADEAYEADLAKYQAYMDWFNSALSDYEQYMSDYIVYERDYNFYTEEQVREFPDDEFSLFKKVYAIPQGEGAFATNNFNDVENDEDLRNAVLEEIRESKKPDESVTDEPNKDDYTVYDNNGGAWSSQEDADRTYDEDLAKYNVYHNWDTSSLESYSSSVTTKYRANDDEEETLFDTLEGAEAKQKESVKPDDSVTTQPYRYDYQYHENKYSSQEEATNASEAAKTEYANSTPIKEEYNVGKFRTNDEATAQFNSDYSAWEAKKPVEANYSVGNYKTEADAEAQCEIDHENFVNNNGQKPTENDEKYSVGYDSEDTAKVQYDGDRATYERTTPAPVEEKYTYGGYTDENSATQAYENAVESYISGTPAPKMSDYNTESAEQYNSAHDEWTGNEPTESDYTYPTAELEAEADANYNAAVSSWENSKPSFDGDLNESEETAYEEAHDTWEAGEPDLENYRN